jgi:hypothetical protein
MRSGDHRSVSQVEKPATRVSSAPPIRTWASPAAVMACAAMAGVACGAKIDTVAIGVEIIGAGGSGNGGNGGNGGVSSVAGNLGAGVTCDDTHPQLPWSGPDGQRTVCTSSFAPSRMSQALCSCGNLGSFGAIRTEAFDSSTQQPAPGTAAVGANGAFETPSAMIGGSLTAASPNVQLISLLDVIGDLRLGGELQISGPLTVARDAWLAQSGKALTIVLIGRDLHVPAGKPLDDSISRGVAGQLVTEEFAVSPPCRCDESSVLDWSTIIESASGQNDNSKIGLTPQALVAPAQATAITLPCGRYYLDGIGGSSDLQLHIEGRVALFVAGDVLNTGQLRVTFGTGAELDWFVGGRLDFERAMQVGDATRPAALRVYVAGEGSLTIPASYVSGNVYAPRSDIGLLGSEDFYGSLFGRTVSGAKSILVHYDAAVQRVGDACGVDSPTSCNDCSQCSGGLACVAGSCGACTLDSECCWPLVCKAGRCSTGAP